jgi:hypothetical protein
MLTPGRLAAKLKIVIMPLAPEAVATPAAIHGFWNACRNFRVIGVSDRARHLQTRTTYS